MKCGGTGDVKAADEGIQKLCNETRQELEQKVGQIFDHYEAMSYKSQMVAGTNYFVKIKIVDGQNVCIHVRLFEPLPHTNESVSLHSFQVDKRLADPIDYF